MAEKKIYSSIIDQFLDDRTPAFEELDLEAAKDEGDKQLSRTHKYVDEEFLDDVAEGPSHHTPVHTGKAINSPDRIKAEREARLAAARGLAQEKEARKRARELGSEGANTNSRYAGKDDYVSEIADDASAFLEKTFNINRAPSKAELEAKSVSDSQIKKYIRELLNEGNSPAKVAAKLDKLAEAQVFNRQMSTDYLNRMAGTLGLAYIEPNSFMNSCPKSMEKLKTKAGSRGIQAKSVKQITACAGCVHFKKNAGQKHCALYRLPIVGNAQELKAVINKITAGVPEANKKATLVKIANYEPERTINTKGSEMISRVGHMTFKESSPERVRVKHTAAQKEFRFDAGSVEDLHKKGHSIEKIYNAAAHKIGSVQAGAAVKGFIEGLRRKGTKVALSQIDCKFLKQKLGVSNAIVGASKCASCVYRQGMHCGLTGGTLVSFPGMDKQASNHKIADGAPKDGRAMLQEYDMMGGFPSDAGDIEYNEPERLDIQMGSSFGLGDVE